MSSSLIGKLPASVGDLRNVLRSVDLDNLRKEVDSDLEGRVCIVGPVNSGKSTLFNYLHGCNLSPVAAVPGTTKGIIREDLGPFTLLDTPGFGEVNGVDRAGLALESVLGSSLAVLVLDAAAGIRSEDYELMRRLATSGKPVLVALNKMDLVKSDAQIVVADAEAKLGVKVTPISAKQGMNVSQTLVPAIINAHPSLAVLIGRELPAFRKQAVNKVIAAATGLSTVVGAEPLPGVSVPLLLGTQAKLVLRIAAIYGESMSAHHARELVATLVGGLATRYLAREVVKFVPVAGWAVAGVMAGASTYAIGQVAVEYFESGKQLDSRRMKSLYKVFARQKREIDQINTPSNPPLIED